MANSREDSVFFDLYNEDTEGAWPDRDFEVTPQERDQRRTVEQIVDNTLIVPSLDVPVPQLENQLVEVCQQLDISYSGAGYRSAQDLISMPSLQAPCALRGADGRTDGGSADDHILFFTYCSGLWSRTSTSPVLGRGGRNVGLQGFLHRQSSTAQLAPQRERISERIVEQIVDSRVVGGGLQDFRPVQSSSASADEPGFRVFSELFSKSMKVPGVGPH